MRASRSAMPCGCARALPGARKRTDRPTPGACGGPWRAAGRAPPLTSRAACRALIRKAQSSTIRPSRAACWARWSRPPRAGRWPTTAPRRSGGLPAWQPTGTGCSRPRAAKSGAGLVSARAFATSAASASWCWRTAKRPVADGSYRPAGANLAGQPDSAPTAFGRLMPGSPAGFGYQWWALPHAPTGIRRGAFSAIGAFGQYIYVNPTERVVVAIQSDWPQHHDAEAAAETFALVGAAVRALRPAPTP